MGLILEIGKASSQGPRSTNQDATDADSHLGFAAVADGMGGAAGGEVASAEALAAVRKVFEETSPGLGGPLEPLLVAAAAAAQRRVCDRAASQPDLVGMGSTLALVLVVKHHYCSANVGDSRVYLFRDQTLTQLSHDHSLVQERLDSGAITQSEAASQPDRNVITRAIGVSGCAGPHLHTGSAQPGDRFLVTSDGVHGVLGKEDLAISDGVETAGDTARRLVQLALERGTRDNASVAVLRVLGSQGLPDRGNRVSWSSQS